MFCDLSDIYLQRPNTQLTQEQGQVLDIKYFHASMQGWRRGMEDAIICHPNFTPQTHLFGVLDGHGGSEVSNVVSRVFPGLLRENKAFVQGNYEKALRETFHSMDKWLVSKEGIKTLIVERYKKPYAEIIKDMEDHKKKTAKGGKGQRNQKQLEDPDFEHFKDAFQSTEVLEMIGQTIVEECGTTANIILIADKVYCANIGDSRSVAIIKNKPVVLSFDHKPEDRIEKSRIQKAGGFVLEGRVCGSLSLSRAFGDYQYKGSKPTDFMVSFEPDITTHELNQFNLLLIACDGIWEAQRDDYGEAITTTAWKLLQKCGDGAVVLRSLIHKILAPKLDEQTLFGLDNMSCILLTFGNEPAPVPKTKTPLPIQKVIKKATKAKNNGKSKKVINKKKETRK